MDGNRDRNIPGSNTRREILQEPEAIRKAMNQIDVIKARAAKIGQLNPKFIIITGSGTSFHSGNAAVYFLHHFACMPCYSVHPSEIPYFTKYIIDKSTVLIPISQSGESSDTIEASKIARDKGAMVIPIVNEEHSTLATLFPEDVIYSRAGKERSILATKTYSAQVAIVSKLALELGLVTNRLPGDVYARKVSELGQIPDKIATMKETIQGVAKQIAKYLKFLDRAFVLGAGPDVATAMEGALKLKEGARILAQGYSTPEFAHGPSTLADKNNLIIVIVPPVEDERERDVLAIISKVKKQGASVLAIYSRGDKIPDAVDFWMEIPRVPVEFNPILSIIPIQYLVLEIALQKHLDPDKPSWLTKVARL
ncbi:MAG: SIS domain-containing protein [Promethearchaeota archaeon]